ncbi:tetratricopeptide repeat protein [Planctomycetota bacterium]
MIEGLYRIEGELARGGMGVVHKATDLATNNLVVIKSLLPKVAQIDEYKQRFIREAEEWVQLGAHPNIVRAFTAHEIEYLPRLILEFIDGISLDDIIYDEGLPPFEQALDIAIQMCWGVAFAHNKGLIHRDLKPANIMIAKDGTVKVTDFGLVKRIFEKAEKQLAASDKVPPIQTLMTHGVIGTPEYIAPEQWEEEESQTSDIYAFGIILFELFCGQRPFDFTHLTGMERITAYQTAHCEKPLPSPGSIHEEIPAPIEQLIKQCLEKNPRHRPKSFHDIGKKINTIAKQLIGESFRQKPAAEEFDRHAKLDQANAYMRLGQGCSFRGDLAKALDLYEKAGDIFKSDNDQKGQAEYFRAVAAICTQQGKLDQSMELFSRQLEIAEVLNDQEMISNCFVSIAIIFRQRSEYDEAITLYQKSLEIKLELNDQPGLANIYYCLAEVNCNRGDNDIALDMYNKSLAIYQTLDDHAGISRCYLCIGNLYQAQNKEDEAYEMFQESLAIKESLGDRSGMSTCYLGIGNVFCRQKQYDSALTMYQKCFDIQEALGNQNGMSISLYSIGNTFRHQGKYEQALDSLRESMDLARALTNRQQISNCLACIGLVYVKLGDDEAAFSNLQQSLDIMKEIGYFRQSEIEEHIADLKHNPNKA